MANFMATTASNGPLLKDPKGVRQVLQRYYLDGDTRACIETDEATGQAHLELYGYNWPEAWKIPDDVSADEFEPDYDVDGGDGFEDFLLALAPFLAEPLTVQAVGAEKCRFPLAACQWRIEPNGAAVEISGFASHAD